MGDVPAPERAAISRPQPPGQPEAFSQVPETGLLFGFASDGLPILLNWAVPTPGPILLAGDRGSGKTAFLQGVVRAASLSHDQGNVQFVAVSDYPEEWSKQHYPGYLAGVYPAYDPSTTDALFQLANWVDTGGDDRAVFLLWDGLDALLHLPADTQDVLRFLLLKGPAAQVWPIVTVNARRGVENPAWMELFHTRIFGRIADPHLEEELSPIPGAGLNTLFAGVQFSMRGRSRWLRFWIPQ